MKEGNRMPGTPGVYTNNEIRMLWYLKRHGPVSRPKGKHPSIHGLLSREIPMGLGAVKAVLRTLEDKCAVLRTYQKGMNSGKFGDMQGNALLKVELTDPNMILPPYPKSVPPQVIDAIENEEMFQRTAVEPSPDAVILALLARNEELQDQVRKLQDVIQQLSAQQERIKRTVPEHLTRRIQDALTPEQWESLSHTSKR
jgi:hypothetical protein